ncbi:hypothetical protein [Aurantimonas endophytica]|uniref:Uncharacterized protein n=1 Tax=Aurantimonas endophytica TaxID=1522175 RepID=A0A7W6HD66_9HYPH|nr:hypothetical protein [Aurantimonas endophytica]MBB4003036.1 hypothetical protein [Aurantimonas endophytica]MCO6403909.1 hypothetical protein [Aurantimonas endophytica]
MSTTDYPDLEINIDDILEENPEDKKETPLRPGASTAPVSGGSRTAAPTEQPWRIDGGLHGIGDDLENRVRSWRNLVRLLKQHRPQLETAAAEREKLIEALGRIVPEVVASGATLKTALDKTQSGDLSDNLAGHFSKNLKALEELEEVAEALTGNLVWMRSVWEQYARTIVQAQTMREEMEKSGNRS